jgi:hypothetical protein
MPAWMPPAYLVKCNVDQFYGIEYEEFPTQIARTAMWLIDHQLNMQVTETFGEYYVRLPLQKAATIVHGNALRIDWQSLLTKESTVTIHAENANVFKIEEPIAEYDTVNIYAKNINIYPEKEKSDQRVVFDFILGNPPFSGSKNQESYKKDDMKLVFSNVKGAGVLDYVSAWYLLAAKYINGYSTKVGFVSTNSISQGEQVGILWNELFNKHKVKIHFAHRTFKWSNEAKNNASVHVVIIGFANFDIKEKIIYEYEDVHAEPLQIKVSNINPYLIEGRDILISSKTNPICNVDQIIKGSETTDDGHLLISEDEVQILKQTFPSAVKFVRPFVGGADFIKGLKRWCLWLKDAKPEEIRNIPLILGKVENVRKFRLNSSKERTRKWASFPTLFSEDRQPQMRYLLFPKVSSERRKYIPLAFLEPDYVINNTVSYLPNASLFSFGILQSDMHMSWMRQVCGRMKSDYIYSNSVVYNNFPWPDNPSDKQKETVEKTA